MQLKEGLFFVLFSFLPGLGYQTIQDRWRIALADSSETVVYLLGIAPNFLGAVSLTTGLLTIARFFRPSATYQSLAFITTLISLLGLLLWEFLQIWLPNGTFDLNDLAWTFPGCALAWAFARLWFRPEWTMKQEVAA